MEESKILHVFSLYPPINPLMAPSYIRETAMARSVIICYGSIRKEFQRLTSSRRDTLVIHPAFCYDYTYLITSHVIPILSGQIVTAEFRFFGCCMVHHTHESITWYISVTFRDPRTAWRTVFLGIKCSAVLRFSLQFLLWLVATSLELCLGPAVIIAKFAINDTNNIAAGRSPTVAD